MNANVEKLAQFPALCEALLHFSHRIATHVSISDNATHHAKIPGQAASGF
ncbi:hypothetical protein [Alistipes sp.]|jgi:hypothetical protein